MKSTLGVVCDFAYIEPASNKLYILGIIRYLRAATPIVLPRVCVAIEFEGTLAESRLNPKLRITLVNADGADMTGPGFEVPLQLMPLGHDRPNQGVASIVIEVAQLRLPAFGTYTFMVFDEAKQAIASVPFTVAAADAPGLPSST